MKKFDDLVPEPSGMLATLARRLRAQRAANPTGLIRVQVTPNQLKVLGTAIAALGPAGRVGVLLSGNAVSRKALIKSNWGADVSDVAVAFAALAFHSEEAQVCMESSRDGALALVGDKLRAVECGGTGCVLGGALDAKNAAGVRWKSGSTGQGCCAAVKFGQVQLDNLAGYFASERGARPPIPGPIFLSTNHRETGLIISACDKDLAAGGGIPLTP